MRTVLISNKQFRNMLIGACFAGLVAWYLIYWVVTGVVDLLLKAVGQ
jgi:hypothetical protein